MDFWKISAEERKNHNASFMKLNPANGFITGEQARNFFLQSGLATPILGQIWNLADINKDGKLDQREFSIACYLIKKVLTSGVNGAPNPSILPNTLPPSLLVDPLATAPILPISTGMSGSGSFSNSLSSSLSNLTLTTMPNTTGLGTLGMSSNLSSSMNPVMSGGIGQNPTSLPNPITVIPQTSRSRYTQMFQSNDTTSTGYVSGMQAKQLLMQTGLPQATLAQIWNLADYDKDGKLTLEEFILAMHFCDFAKAGNSLPQILPLELQPQRSRSSSSMSSSSMPGAVPLPGLVSTTPIGIALAPTPVNTDQNLDAKQSSVLAASFEEKRRENFDRGNAVLEAKRQALREAEEREKREREEKERLEQEKKQKLREEQERRRQAELEKQMERQRQIDAQREEERRKAFEKQEAARNELIRQQRLEWERQKKQELEAQKLKLHEQISTLKAKDKNLEYDMEALNDKISTYKTKIADTQTNLIDLNTRLETTQKANAIKQSEFETIEKQIRDYSQNLTRLGQERFMLSEKQKNLNQDNPFAEEYRNDSTSLKMKQTLVQQLKAELEQIEAQINATRTQFEIAKHVLEVSESDAADTIKENQRLEQLLNLKRGAGMNGTNGSSFVANGVTATASAASTTPIAANPVMKTSQSINSLKSNNQAKDNYDVFKDEITKIQQTSIDKSQPTSPTPINASNSIEKVNAEFTSVDWSSAFDQPSAAGATSDPFAAISSVDDSADPFSSSLATPAKSTTMKMSNTSNFDDLWSSSTTGAASSSIAATTTAATTSNADPFATNEPVKSTDAFGTDDNWAALASNADKTNTSNDWAAFDDNAAPAANYSALSSLASTTPNYIKYKVLYNFDAGREDELTIREGEIVNVDLSVKTDEGWLSGELNGRTGVFPAGFTIKLSDLESINEENNFGAFDNNFGAFDNNFGAFSSQPLELNQLTHQQQPTQPLSTVQNYHISLFAYDSTEPGDLTFREFEIINVIDKNEDWLTGQVVGSGVDPSYPLRHGIFPSNFVVKFNFPLQYIGKYAIALATEVYLAQETGQLTLDPLDTQIIAIKKVAPDGKWSFGETYDANNVQKRGWFPTQSVTIMIESTVPAIVLPSNTTNSSPSSIAALNTSTSFNNASSLNNSMSSPPASVETTPVASTVTHAKTKLAPHTAPKPPVAAKKSTSASPISSNPASPTGTSGTPSAAVPVSPSLPSLANNADQNGGGSSNTASTKKSSIVNAVNNNTSNPSAPISQSNSISSIASSNKPNSAGGPTSSVSNGNIVKSSESKASLNGDHKKRINSNGHEPNVASTMSNASIALSSSTTPTAASSAAAASSVAASATTPVAVVEQPSSTSTPAATTNDLPPNVIDQVIALYDFQATTPETIGFQKDAIINILEKSGDWWLGEYNGKMGLLPFNYVQSILNKNSQKLEETTNLSTSSSSRTNQQKTSQAVKSTGVANSSSCISLGDTTNRARSTRKKRSAIPSSASLGLALSNEKLANLYVNNFDLNDLQLNDPNNNVDDADLDNDDDDDDYSYVHQNNSSYQTNNNNSYINIDYHRNNSQLVSSNSNLNSEDTASNSSATISSNTQINKNTQITSNMKFNVINEFIHTERNYIKNLKDIVECFKLPLEQNRIVSRQEINSIFVNIDDLIALNTDFYNQLVKRIDDARNSDQQVKIGDLLIEYFPKMTIYSKYVSAKRSSEEIIMEKMKNSNEFSQIVNRAIEGETGDFLLKKLLLLPMQRLTQYSLLIDKLIKHTNESDDDYLNLRKSSKLIVDLIRMINNEVGKRDDQERLAWLEEHVNVKGMGFKFRSQTNIMGSRKLYYYGPLVKESSGKELYGFLFNDCLLIVEAYDQLHNEIFRPSSSSRNSKFQQLQVYKQPIILDSITCVQCKQSQNSSDCTFQLLTDREYLFRTSNPSLRNEWIKQIQKSIEMYKQKKRSSGTSLASYHSMVTKSPIGRLLLLVMEAQDLIVDPHFERNSFCEALMGSQKFATPTIETTNPRWNTSMQFQIYDLSKDVLTVSVYDRRIFSPNTFLGKCDLKIMQIYRDQMKENQENNPITRSIRLTNVSRGKIVLKMSISIYK